MMWITIFNAFVIVYFAVLNAVYITLMVIAFRRLRRYVDRIHSLDIDGLVASSGGLPISLITPAFNEEATIVQSVRSLLTLRYAEYEIVVVNDGSTDGTLDRLIEAYDLHPVERVPTASIATQTVSHVYGSDRHPTLFVVDKANGGKADALNAGLNYARGSVFCALDGDTLLEPDSLARMVRPFLEDATTVAVGGIIRIVNGCDVESGAVEDVALPQGLLPRFQVLEYLRAFLATRVGWDAVGSTLIISGAFGAFRRSTVGAAGGFDTETVGEDMELVVRLHRHCRENGTPYRVVFIPDPVAWTEVPESLSQLARQRDRWQRGLAQVLWRHRAMLGRSKYGVPGTVGLPFLFFFELLSPIVELMGWAILILAAVLGVISPPYVVAFLLLAVFMGSALSITAVALEELSFRRYRRLSDLLILLTIGLVESFGYRQMTTYWRLHGLWSWLRGDRQWGDMQRRGFATQTPETPSKVPAGR